MNLSLLSFQCNIYPQNNPRQIIIVKKILNFITVQQSVDEKIYHFQFVLRRREILSKIFTTSKFPLFAFVMLVADPVLISMTPAFPRFKLWLSLQTRKER